tara:strand:- start:421 stop:783 length:363 start_codon:yes stop_codon:yes gene_type:complete
MHINAYKLGGANIQVDGNKLYYYYDDQTFVFNWNDKNKRYENSDGSYIKYTKNKDSYKDGDVLTYNKDENTTYNGTYKLMPPTQTNPYTDTNVILSDATYSWFYIDSNVLKVTLPLFFLN